MTRKELIALADVFGQLDQLIKDVTAHGNGLDSIERLGLVQVAIGRIADGLQIAVKYPQLRELPLEYLQKDATWLRARMAAIEADRIDKAGSR